MEKKITVNTLVPGNVCLAGYKRGDRNFTDIQRFVGFKVGDCHFTNLKQLKAHFGVSNLRDLEFEADRLELGSVTAEFYECDGQFFWAAYLWAGKFCVGTSADRLTLAAV